MDIDDDPCTCLMPGRDFTCPACQRAKAFLQALEEQDPPGRRWYNHADGDISFTLDVATIVHACKGTPPCPDCNSRHVLYLTDLPEDHEDHADPDEVDGINVSNHDWMIGLSHDASCPHIGALRTTGN